MFSSVVLLRTVFFVFMVCGHVVKLMWENDQICLLLLVEYGVKHQFNCFAYSVWSKSYVLVFVMNSGVSDVLSKSFQVENQETFSCIPVWCEVIIRQTERRFVHFLSKMMYCNVSLCCWNMISMWEWGILVRWFPIAIIHFKFWNAYFLCDDVSLQRYSSMRFHSYKICADIRRNGIQISVFVIRNVNSAREGCGKKFGTLTCLVRLAYGSNMARIWNAFRGTKELWLERLLQHTISSVAENVPNFFRWKIGTRLERFWNTFGRFFPKTGYKFYF